MAADGQIDEGPPLTELESLQLKANNITDESLDSTRRMITLCEEVKKTFTDNWQIDRVSYFHPYLKTSFS